MRELSVKEAAKELGYSDVFVRRLIEDGKIKAEKRGTGRGVWVIPEYEVYKIKKPFPFNLYDALDIPTDYLQTVELDEAIDLIDNYIFRFLPGAHSTEVAVMYFVKDMNFSQIAEEIGVGRERVRQIYEKVIRMLKSPKRVEILQYGSRNINIDRRDFLRLKIDIENALNNMNFCIFLAKYIRNLTELKHYDIDSHDIACGLAAIEELIDDAERDGNEGYEALTKMVQNYLIEENNEDTWGELSFKEFINLNKYDLSARVCGALLRMTDIENLRRAERGEYRQLTVGEVYDDIVNNNSYELKHTRDLGKKALDEVTKAVLKYAQMFTNS